WGRQRQATMTSGDRLRILARGGFGTASAALQNQMMSGRFTESIQTPWVERLREGGFGGLFGYDSTRAGRLGGLGAPTRMGQVGDRVTEVAGGTVEPLGRAAEIAVGGGLVVSARDAETAVRRAQLRADTSRRLKDDFKDNDESQRALLTISQAYKKALFTPETARRLAEAKERFK